MAKDAKTRAKARRLLEVDSFSVAKISEIVDAAPRTIQNWMDEDAENGNPWVKGQFAEKLHEKEMAAAASELEKAGITKGRFLAELAGIGFSDMEDFVMQDPDSQQTRVRSFEDMNKKRGGASRAIKRIRVTSRRILGQEGQDNPGLIEETVDLELHPKLPALQEIGNVTGWRRGEAGTTDDFRDFFGSLKA